jgi:hypothetical protein
MQFSSICGHDCHVVSCMCVGDFIGVGIGIMNGLQWRRTLVQ